MTEEDTVVREYMQKLAALSTDDSLPADPTYLWWKAEVLCRWDAQRRATAPIDVGEHLLAGVGLLAAVVMLQWLWAGPGLSQTMWPVLIVSVGILGATAFAAVRNLSDGL
jgi:hypothetical protein